ncbi:MAG: tetratricopeptide repeat protein [Candidatus Rokubacteria bacterium]|nr:tetratricopeptide repeat protein [Candidatus Rokubacteria bacterium]
MGGGEWLISHREVVRLLRITPRRSAQLRRLGLFKPEGAGYRFREVVGLRVAADLLDTGATVRQIRQALDDLKRFLPEAETPLAEIRLILEGGKLLAESERVRFDPRSGQTVMALDVEGLASAVENTLARGVVRPLVPPAEAAEVWFQRASELDQDPARWEEAVEAYGRVVVIDPTYAAAWNNLGLLHHRMGRYAEARECYRVALEADPACVQAAYNLGSLHEDLGDAAAAAEWYRRSLEQDPGYADAHFNLASLLARTGENEEARRHWKIYLQLDRASPWAAVARSHLTEPEDE